MFLTRKDIQKQMRSLLRGEGRMYVRPAMGTMDHFSMVTKADRREDLP